MRRLLWKSGGKGCYDRVSKLCRSVALTLTLTLTLTVTLTLTLTVTVTLTLTRCACGSGFFKPIESRPG